jgi:hypothetical protein
MNPGDVIDKTVKGLQEVKSKGLGLPPRLRSLLIMADGRQTLSQLQSAASQIGAPADALQQLLQQGLVTTRGGAAPPRAPAAGPVAAAASAQPLDLPLDVPVAGTDPGDRLRAAQKFMNNTAVDALGMRAVFFTLKIERCYNRDDLLALMPEYRRLMTKASGDDAAQVLEVRARAILL